MVSAGMRSVRAKVAAELGCRAGPKAESPAASASGSRGRIVIGVGDVALRSAPLLHTASPDWFAVRGPIDKLPVHAGRRGVRIQLLAQAVAEASSYADYVSPIHRLWKYVVLGVTSIVFEEANPIFGGIAANHRRLGLIGVITAVAVGTWIPSVGLYFLGRWRIEWVRARFPSWQRLLDAALALVQRNPWRSSLVVRFAYGLRLPVPIACGAARVSLPEARSCRASPSSSMP